VSPQTPFPELVFKTLEQTELQRTGCPVPRVVNLSVVAVHNFILQPVAL
jgi:hypothetical protein